MRQRGGTGLVWCSALGTALVRIVGVEVERVGDGFMPCPNFQSC